MAYLGTMTQKTYLRLKRTNPKLLICHGCRKELIVGDSVVWAAGAQRKRYHKSCADRYNIVYDTDAEYSRQLGEEIAKDLERLVQETNKPNQREAAKDDLNNGTLTGNNANER
jgi:hypothetical protein